MSKMYVKLGMDFLGMFNEEKILVVNNKNIIIKKFVEVFKDDFKKDEVRIICEYIMDLVKIVNKELDVNEMDEFIKRSN